MALRWFDTTEVAAFATGLVEDYCRTRSSAAARGDKTPRLEGRLQRLADSANAFKRNLGINVYKKARLIELIRDGLAARGIAAGEIEVFVNALLFGPLARPEK